MFTVKKLAAFLDFWSSKLASDISFLLCGDTGCSPHSDSDNIMTLRARVPSNSQQNVHQATIWRTYNKLIEAGALNSLLGKVGNAYSELG